MKEFVYGSDQQYEKLKKMLDDHLCHVFSRCKLPACCNKQEGRIGFEKEQDTYALFIDKNIFANTIAPLLFQTWLTEGVLRFLDFTDMKEFLRGLKCLY